MGLIFKDKYVTKETKIRIAKNIFSQKRKLDHEENG